MRRTIASYAGHAAMNCCSKSSGSVTPVFASIARISSGVDGGRWLKSVRLSSLIAAIPNAGLLPRAKPIIVARCEVIKAEIGRERDADRGFADPHLGKRQDVGASPADPDLFRRGCAEGDGRGRGRRGGHSSALDLGRGDERTRSAG